MYKLRSHRTLLISLSTAILAIACYFLFEKLYNQETKLSKYSSDVSLHLIQQENEVDSILNSHKAQFHILTGYETGSNVDIDLLEQLEQRAYTILIYDQYDSLVLWTNDKINFKDEEKLFKLKDYTKTSFNKLASAHYLVKNKLLEYKGRSLRAQLLFPIKYTYSLSSNYLQGIFAGLPQIPTNITLSVDPSPYEIHSASGHQLCYLKAQGPLKEKRSQRIYLILYIAFWLSIIIAISNIGEALVQKNRSLRGVFFFLASLSIIRIGTIVLNISDSFKANFAFFTPIDNGPIASISIGDFIISSLIILSGALFVFKNFKFKDLEILRKSSKIYLIFLSYFLVLASLLFVISTTKEIVLDSSISFGFENVFSLHQTSILAIGGIVVLLFALFIFNMKIMQFIAYLNVLKKERMICILGNLVFLFPALSILQLEISFVQVLLVCLIYLLLFDLFSDEPKLNLTWLILWLLVYSTFTSSLLFKYNNNLDEYTRLQNATELAENRDNRAESKLDLFVSKIKSERFISNAIVGDTWDDDLEEKLKNEVDRLYDSEPYLYSNYDYKLKIERSQIFENIPVDPRIDKSKNESKIQYESIVAIRNLNPDEEGILLNFTFQKKALITSNVYSELFRDKDEIEYDYSIYKNSKLKVDGDNIPLEHLNIPEIGRGVKTLVAKMDRSEYVYNHDGVTLVVLGKKYDGYMKPISLFSFIFVCLILFCFVISIINTFTGIIPDFLSFTFKNPSLGNRVQASVITLILVSFVIIGLATVIYFKNANETYHTSRLERKAKRVLIHANSEIDHLDELNDQQKLDEIINRLTNIHGMDINLYDLSGVLMLSSNKEIYDKGLLGNMMNPIAYHRLLKGNESDYQNTSESIGSLKYQSWYEPIRDINDKAIGFLGLPYYSKQRELKSNDSDFMSTLLNVYVFLLLIASSITIFVANSITNPILKIGLKLKEFKLGGKNEPLEWKTNDELGQLIGEYNNMIEEVKNSAKLLAQSEREGAWREAAQQVAHEIKNPLTPMKLSIQQLQRAYKMENQNIDELIEKVTHTMIEQIEGLTRIANEFSHFAKMPKARNEMLNLNEIISSVYNLHKQQSHIDFSLQLTPIDPIVFADKDHLVRVFNNIFKNAVEAISENENGHIKIKVAQLEQRVRVSIKDNGGGIADEEKDKIFIPKFTTKSSGTGIGLAMTKNIVESLKGSIYFESTQGIGTTFHVEIPLSTSEKFAEELIS